MDKQALVQSWDQTRQKYGIYLRVLEAIPEDRFHTHPAADMRTPAELVAHVSGSILRDIAKGVAKGEITADESAESDVAAGLKTKAEVLGFAKSCWEEADTAVASIGDDELQKVVNTPWNMSFPGRIGFSILNDEFIHHRGQLFVFARLCGVAPPFIWGFADNDPEFRPAS